MPVASQIDTAAHIYSQDANMITKSFDGLTVGEWTRRPNSTSNSMLWVVGHTIWARSIVLKILGVQWTRPWLALFARGAAVVEDSLYPEPEELALCWDEISAALTSALQNASIEVLSAPSAEKSPSFDGTVGGMVSFLAFHDAYHAGQAAYLRRWLGCEGVAG